jgi:uncharacterized protein (TIGR03437 family)
VNHGRIRGWIGGYRLFDQPEEKLASTLRSYIPYAAAPPSVNITISGNVIDRPNNWLTRIIDTAQFGGIQALAWTEQGTPMLGSPMQNITISNNFVADPRRSGTWMGNTTGGTVSGNYLFDANNDPAPQTSTQQPYRNQFLQPLVVDASQNVTTNNNAIDTTSGRMWVTDTQFRELAAYAPGSTIRLNAYSLGELSSPNVKLTDADGQTNPVPIQSITTHALDVQIPAMAGLGGAFLTLTSGDTKYSGTLFLDSQDNIPALNGCTYELSPSSTLLPTSGSVSILVVTQPGCAYNLTADDPSATVSGPGAGSGVATVIANSTTTIEIAGQPIRLTALPAIQTVYDSWNYTPAAAPGARVTITGSSLATGLPQTVSLTGVQPLPTTLNGSSVLFDGTPVALLYVSPTRIDVLVPASIEPGPVQVTVQANGVSSSPFTVAATATLPALYALPSADGGAFFVTAALAGTSLLVGNSEVDPSVLRAAQPGDTLDLSVIGVGATADPSNFVTDRGFSGTYPVSAPVSVMVGGEPAPVVSANLTSPGLYIVRITVPSDLGPGPSPIQVTVGNSQTPSSVVLMLSAAPQENLVSNGSFESALTGNWQLFTDGTTGASATVQRDPSTSVDGSYSAEISVTTAATPATNFTAVKLSQPGLAVQQDHVYMLQFWAKADAARTMWMIVGQNGDNLPAYGLNTGVGLGGDWQRYVLYFRATTTDPAARLNFYFGDQTGDTWLDAVVLQDTSQ